jgi:hypothetical protein
MMVEEMQKYHQFIIMHCANNVKGYTTFQPLQVDKMKVFVMED